MKNYILKNSFILLSLFLLASCDLTEDYRGSNDLITLERDLSSFQNIIAEDHMTVNITQGPVQQVSVTTNSNLTENLITRVEDNTLRIDLKNGSYRSTTFIVDIQIPDLKKLRFDDAVDGELFLMSEEVTIEMHDAAEIYLMGNADVLNIDMTDASKIFGYEFLANTVNLRSEDASKLEISVIDLLQGKATDGSKISYKGNPTINVKTEDAAKVINEN
ncbi:MAG: DUF2807 domain-containing protein [Cyclobacteriaceae bacterium]|nr:DUF2807 domain-containing protein [Cyclobacteriaceae bacterium]